MARNYDINGLFNWAAGFIPNNLNIKTWLVDTFDILGGPQIFDDIQDLVDFHPLKMKKGMTVTITDFPNGGVNTVYQLNTDPAFLIDGNEDTIVTLANYRSYYDEKSQTITSKDVVYQYAPNYLGGQPLYPYTSDNALRNERDGVWHAGLNKPGGDRWFRSRDNDDFTMYTDPDAGPDIKVYDNWTRPLPFGAVFEPGDYIENRFKREVQGTTGITLAANLVLNDFYLVVAGLVTATRTSDGAEFLHAEGGTFEALSTFSYVFTDVGTTVDTIPDIPARTTAGGFPNNEPAGWTDTIPAGTVQLWQIEAHKSVYGQLKSEWVIEKITESPELLRYSSKTTPHPDTLMGTGKSVADLYDGTPAPSVPAYVGLTYEQILVLEGWQSAFTEGQTDFIAQRTDAGAPPWSTWVVDKIGDESGEYTDYVYKLLPINISAANLLLETPVAADPSSEGFHDGPQIETDTEINYVSRARKFFDGTLKTDWSDLVPYTGADLFISGIVLEDGNDFKFDPNSATPTVPVPTELRMYAQIHKGLSELWKTAGNVLAFKWEIIFNNGAAIVPPTEIVSTTKTDNAYLKLAIPITMTGTITSTGTAVVGVGTLFLSECNPGEWIKTSDGQIRQILSVADNLNLVLELAFSPDVSGLTIENSYLTTAEDAEGYRDNQILVVKHPAVTGKAYFRLTTTLTTDEGDIVFTNTENILDITDGIDRKALEIGVTNQLVLYDTVAEVFAPVQALMHAMFSNLPTVTQFYWYFNNGAGYTAIDGTETNYGISGTKDEVLTIDIQSTPAAKTGTVTSTGTTVDGSGTLFSTEFIVGSYVKADGQIRKIATISSSILMTTDTAFSPAVSGDSIERIDCLFDRDQTAGQLQIALSTHATDPTAADGINDLTDYSTIAKSSSAGIGTDGDDPAVSLLTQEAYTTVLDAVSGIPLAGELGTAGNVQTDIIVYKGETRLDYNAGDFSVVKGADPTGITTQAIRQSPTDSLNGNVWVDTGGWVADTRSGIIILTITTSAPFGSIVMTKEFALASTKDAPGAILLDIDSDGGFSFDRKPGGLVNKTLEARLYDVLSGVQTELDPADYYYDWSGPVTQAWTAGGGGTNGEFSPQISKASVFADAVVICKVSEFPGGSPVLREASVRINDFSDSKTYRLFSAQVSKPATPIDATDPEATQGVWAKTVVDAIWASDGSEKDDASNPPVYEFSEPYQIAGETGIQGQDGGFILTMYKNSAVGVPATIPSSTATLTQMETDNWLYIPPVAVAGQLLWVAQRAFLAWSAPATPVVFTAGKPDTDPMAGSEWIGPNQVSGFDGINGDFFEFRYQKNTSSSTPPALDTGNRNPSGWSVTVPTRLSGEYVWFTKALINGDTDALIGVWQDASLHSGDVGDQGTKGLGWKLAGTGYNASTGITTFASDDGLGFSTGDLRAPSRADLIAKVASGGGVTVKYSDGATWTTNHSSTGIYALKRNGGNVGDAITLVTVRDNGLTTFKVANASNGVVTIKDENGNNIDSDFFIQVYL